MIDFRCCTIALGLALIATTAVAQEHGGHGGNERPNHQEQGAGQSRPGRPVAAAAGFRHRAQHRHADRQARLHGDRRYAVVVRSIGRALGRRFLYSLRCEIERRGTAGDVRVQRRTGRRLGVPQSRPGRSAHCYVRRQLRRRQRPFGRQPGHLARLHRSGVDRSGRHRLEPAGQGQRRRRLLERASRRRIVGESDRALRRQERPPQFAEIHSRRKLWRLPRRQGGSRRCKATKASSSTASSWYRR